MPVPIFFKQLVELISWEQLVDVSDPSIVYDSKIKFRSAPCSTTHLQKSPRFEVECPPVAKIPKDGAFHHLSRRLVYRGFDLAYHRPPLGLRLFARLGLGGSKRAKSQKPTPSLLKGGIESNRKLALLGTPISQDILHLFKVSQLLFGGPVRPQGLDDGVNGLFGVLFAGLCHGQSCRWSIGYDCSRLECQNGASSYQ